MQVDIFETALGSSRHRFLDLYRGIVVLLMLEGHLVREVLGSAWRDTPGFRLHELVHGLTAPGFLFGAGFTFAIAVQKKGNILRGLNSQMLRRLWRGVMLILVGYALHVPYLSLSKTLSEASRSQWQEFLAFDVLQVIGLGLVLLRVLFLIFRDDKWFLGAVATLASFIVLFTPTAWNIAAEGRLPLALATSMSGHFGSPFPLFPSLAFMLAGVLVSWGFLHATRAEQERSFMMKMMGLGLIALAAGTALAFVPVGYEEPAAFWSTSPGFIFIRLGLLLVALGALWSFESRVTDSPSAKIWMPLWLTTVGMESLFVYIAHLLLLYGWVTNPDLHIGGLLGRDLPPLFAGLWSLLFMFIMAPAAKLWHYLKIRHAVIMRIGYWWMGLTIAGEFLRRGW